MPVGRPRGEGGHRGIPNIEGRKPVKKPLNYRKIRGDPEMAWRKTRNADLCTGSVSRVLATGSVSLTI